LLVNRKFKKAFFALDPNWDFMIILDQTKTASNNYINKLNICLIDMKRLKTAGEFKNVLIGNNIEYCSEYNFTGLKVYTELDQPATKELSSKEISVVSGLNKVLMGANFISQLQELRSFEYSMNRKLFYLSTAAT